jgi:hypothetical protein
MGTKISQLPEQTDLTVSGTENFYIPFSRTASPVETRKSTFANFSDGLRYKVGLAASAVRRLLRDCLAERVSIDDFGAKANDPAFDNIPAINLAITFLNSVGGGDLYIPKGVYWVKPLGNDTNVIVPKSNVTIRGLSRKSILKCWANTGNYRRLIGTDNAVVDFGIENFTIDQNPAANTTCDVGNGAADDGLMALRMSNVQGLRVYRMRFEQNCGVNTVWVAGSNCRDLCVEHCSFNFKRARSVSADGNPIATESPIYDSSDVYVQAFHIRICNNTFLTSEVGTARPNGACEIHGPVAAFTGNVITGYGCGLHIVTPYDSAANVALYGISVSGNTIREANWGISLIAVAASDASPTAIRGFSITGNMIDVRQLDYDRVQAYGIGVLTDAVSSIEDGVIATNTITMQSGDTRFYSTLYGGSGNSPTSKVLTINSGIHMLGSGTLRNVLVTGNNIKNAPLWGIAVGFTTAEGILVTRNKLTDCGLNTGHEWTSLRAAISIGGGTTANMSDIISEDNYISDTGASSLNTLYGTLASGGTITRCQVGGNNVYTKSGNILPNNINYAKPFHTRHRWPGIYLSNGWITAPMGTFTFQVGQGVMTLSPVDISVNGTFTNLSCEVTVAGDTTAVARMGVYASDEFGNPKTLLVDANTVACTTTGNKTIALSPTLKLLPGRYWLAGVSQGVPTTNPTFRFNTGSMGSVVYTTAANATSLATTGYQLSGVTSALPVTLSGILATTNAFKVAAQMG